MSKCYLYRERYFIIKKSILIMKLAAILEYSKVITIDLETRGLLTLPYSLSRRHRSHHNPTLWFGPLGSKIFEMFHVFPTLHYLPMQKRHRMHRWLPFCKLSACSEVYGSRVPLRYIEYRYIKTYCLHIITQSSPLIPLFTGSHLVFNYLVCICFPFLAKVRK